MDVEFHHCERLYQLPAVFSSRNLSGGVLNKTDTGVRDLDEAKVGGQRASRQTAEAGTPLLHLRRPSEGKRYPDLPLN